MKHQSKRLVLLALALAVGVAACGGDYTPVDQNHSGTLADGTEHGGRTCDAYEVSVGRGWHVTAEMTSEWDNYLYLAKGNEDVAMNDDTNGLDAAIDTDVEMAGMYTVYACAYSGGHGAYQLHIATSEGN